MDFDRQISDIESAIDKKQEQYDKALVKGNSRLVSGLNEELSVLREKLEGVRSMRRGAQYLDAEQSAHEYGQARKEAFRKTGKALDDIVRLATEIGATWRHLQQLFSEVHEKEDLAVASLSPYLNGRDRDVLPALRLFGRQDVESMFERDLLSRICAEMPQGTSRVRARLTKVQVRSSHK